MVSKLPNFFAHPCNFQHLWILSCVQSFDLSRIRDRLSEMKGASGVCGLGWVGPYKAADVQWFLIYKTGNFIWIDLMHTTHFKYLAPSPKKGKLFFSYFIMKSFKWNKSWGTTTMKSHIYATPIQLSRNCHTSFTNPCTLSLCSSILFILFYFWPYHAACGILVPRPGTEPAPPALEAQSLNHWTTREVPCAEVF